MEVAVSRPQGGLGVMNTFGDRPSVRVLHLQLVFLLVVNGLVPSDGISEHILGEGGEEKEYCQLETFEASCAENEVVVMSSARYGRMQLGRCIMKDYGSLGCSADVMAEVDRLCSGRQTCSFPVASLHGTQPCSLDLVPHLQASYYCQTVLVGDGRVCSSAQPTVLTAPSGYISNFITSETGRGGPGCPWLIQVPSGQKINITLINFSRISMAGPGEQSSIDRPKVCYQYANIKDADYMRTLTECEEGRRVVHAYDTTSNSVKIEILARKSNGVHFMLYYEAVGCPDPALPSAIWVQRKGDTATVKCNSTGHTWHLTCKDNAWLGEVGNCTTTTVVSDWHVDQMFKEGTFPYSILIVVAIGVALGVFLGGILLVCASRYFKRRRHQQPCPDDEFQQGLYAPDTPSGKIMVANYESEGIPVGASPRHIQYHRGRPGEFTMPKTEKDCKCLYSPYGSLPPPGYPVSQTSGHVYESPQFERKDS